MRKDLVKSARSYFSISYAPWDFRYARMRNADLFVLGGGTNERDAQPSLLVGRARRRTYRADINALDASTGGVGLQVAIQCPSAPRKVVLPTEGRAHVRTRERRQTVMEKGRAEHRGHDNFTDHVSTR